MEEVDIVDEKIKDINVVIDETKNEIQITIEKVIERGDKLEDLEENSTNLQVYAEVFHKQAKKTRWKMCKQKCKANMLLIVVTVIILIILLSIIAAFV